MNKLCKDCTWSKESDLFLNTLLCTHPLVVKTHARGLVHGEIDCVYERQRSSFFSLIDHRGVCGTDGKLFSKSIK